MYFPLPPEESAQDLLTRESIRIAAEGIGVTLDDVHVSAVQWELIDCEDGFYARWKFAHQELDMDLVARVVAEIRE